MLKSLSSSFEAGLRIGMSLGASECPNRVEVDKRTKPPERFFATTLSDESDS